MQAELLTGKDFIMKKDWKEQNRPYIKYNNGSNNIIIINKINLKNVFIIKILLNSQVYLRI